MRRSDERELRRRTRPPNSAQHELLHSATRERFKVAAFARSVALAVLLLLPPWRRRLCLAARSWRRRQGSPAAAAAPSLAASDSPVQSSSSATKHTRARSHTADLSEEVEAELRSDLFDLPKRGVKLFDLRLLRRGLLSFRSCCCCVSGPVACMRAAQRVQCGSVQAALLLAAAVLPRDSAHDKRRRLVRADKRSSQHAVLRLVASERVERSKGSGTVSRLRRDSTSLALMSVACCSIDGRRALQKARMATMRRRAEPAAAVAPAAFSPTRVASSKHEAVAAVAEAAPSSSSSCSTCVRRAKQLVGFVLLGSLTWLAWQIGYLAFAYRYPSFAPLYAPTLERGVFVTLGHTTGTSQLLWSHCTPACRALYCKELGAAEAWTQPEQQLAQCIEHMQVAVAFRPSVVSQQQQESEAEAVAPQPWSIMSTPHPLPHLQLTDTMVSTRVFELTPLQPCSQYEYQLLLTLASPSSASPTATTSRRIMMLQDRFWTGPEDHQAACRNGALQQQPIAVAAGSSSSSSVSSSLVSSPVPVPDLRMVWGSCLGISPISNIRAFDFLASRLSPNSSHANAVALRPLDFVLLLGDIVYTDIPALEDRRAYEQIWNDQGFRSLFTKVPFYGMFDDHELVNDWTLVKPHS